MMHKDFDKNLQSDIRHVLLNQWDPVGIKLFDGPEDEYDSYVLRIYSMFLQKKSKNDLFNYLRWQENQHMGLTGNKEHTRKVVDQLFMVFDKYHERKENEVT